MLAFTGEIRNTTTLEIVWRNPNPVPHRRRHSFERADGRAPYILEEFVEGGQLGHWATISGLEVVLGGPAA